MKLLFCLQKLSFFDVLVAVASLDLKKSYSRSWEQTSGAKVLYWPDASKSCNPNFITYRDKVLLLNLLLKKYSYFNTKKMGFSKNPAPHFVRIFLQELDLIIINFEICLKGLCHAIWYLFVKLRRSSVVSIQSRFDTNSLSIILSM